MEHNGTGKQPPHSTQFAEMKITEPPDSQDTTHQGIAGFGKAGNLGPFSLYISSRHSIIQDAADGKQRLKTDISLNVFDAEGGKKRLTKVTLERLPILEEKPSKGMRSKHLKALYGSALDPGPPAANCGRNLNALVDAHVPEMQQHASHSVFKDDQWRTEAGMEDCTFDRASKMTLPGPLRAIVSFEYALADVADQSFEHTYVVKAAQVNFVLSQDKDKDKDNFLQRGVHKAGHALKKTLDLEPESLTFVLSGDVQLQGPGEQDGVSAAAAAAPKSRVLNVKASPSG